MLLLTIVSSKTEMHEVFKFPLLLHHFFEHREDDKSISFIDFIQMHYSEGSHQKQNHHHEKLPFKSHCTQLNYSIADVIFNADIAIQFELSPGLKTPAIYQEPYYGLTGLDNIWQPPKTV